MKRWTTIGWAGFILAMGPFSLPATQASAAPVELQVWSAFPELHDQATWIAGKYMGKNPNIKIKTTLFPQRALEEKVAVALPAGQAADLIELDKMALYPYYAAGHLAPLPKEVVDWAKKNFPDYSVVSVTSDKGEIFTFPWLNSLKAMFYNKDHFKEAGLTKTPETIDEMMEMARKLTKRDEKGTSPGQGWICGFPGAASAHPRSTGVRS